MPRKKEPSFALKQIIWDIAATVGRDNYSAIYREVDEKLRQLHKNEELYEDETPHIRTLQNIIELDIQRLSKEVVMAKLPPHVWRLRNDYEAIVQLAERVKMQPADYGAPGLPDQRHFEHWARLGEVAEELKLGLEFDRGMNNTESRFGGTVWGEWKFEPRRIEVSFSAQKKKLWKYFLEHMNAEYPSFSDDFRRYLDIASRLVKDNLDTKWGQDLHPVRSCPDTEALKQKLEKVIERGTFKGTCDLCRDWTD